MYITFSYKCILISDGSVKTQSNYHFMFNHRFLPKFLICKESGPSCSKLKLNAVVKPSIC